MGIIGWIVLGLIVGALAKLVMPGKDGGGLILTCILGVIGGFVGGLLGKYIFHVNMGTFWDLRTWVLALVGAVVVLVLYRLLFRRRKVTS